MRPALASTETRRIAAENVRPVSTHVGERLAWPRAALFVLGLCAAIWLSLGYLATRLFG